ncbi:MAG: hypothetical protein M3Y70_08800 [Pseudomonadota bacterium]|nr:hypothetical protein [Pseudomonadota bacterium]
MFEHVGQAFDHGQHIAGPGLHSAQALHPRTREFALHHPRHRGDRLVHAIGRGRGAGFARAPALRRQRRQRCLQAVGEVGCAATRLRQVLVSRLGQCIDRFDQRLHFAQARRRQACIRTARQAFEVAADPVQRLQADPHLQPGRQQQDQPQAGQEQRQFAAELGARIGERRLVLGELHDHRRVPRVHADLSLQDRHRWLERPGGVAQAPGIGRGIGRDRERAVPQRT